MSTNSSTVPKWIYIYLWFTFLLTLGASLTAYFKPAALLGSWEAIAATGSLSLAGPLGLFVSRNLGTAAVTLFGLLKKQSSMILVVLILRIVSDGFDFINNIIANNMPVAIMGAVMCVVEIAAFAIISKRAAKCTENQ